MQGQELARFEESKEQSWKHLQSEGTHTPNCMTAPFCGDWCLDLSNLELGWA